MRELKDPDERRRLLNPTCSEKLSNLKTFLLREKGESVIEGVL